MAFGFFGAAERREPSEEWHNVIGFALSVSCMPVAVCAPVLDVEWNDIIPTSIRFIYFPVRFHYQLVVITLFESTVIILRAEQSLFVPLVLCVRNQEST